MTDRTVFNLMGKPRPVEETRVIAGVPYAGYREWPGATVLTWTPIGDPTRPVFDAKERDVYRYASPAKK